MTNATISSFDQILIAIEIPAQTPLEAEPVTTNAEMTLIPRRHHVILNDIPLIHHHLDDTTLVATTNLRTKPPQCFPLGVILQSTISLYFVLLY